jgi:glycosyltransferase involved in cell wall biosynthesis
MTAALLETTPSQSRALSAQPKATRVLHLINGEHYAGAERVQDLLAESLPKEGFDVSFACVKPVKFPQTRQAQGAPLYRLPMRSKFDLRAAHGVARLIRRQSFALLHTHTPRTAMVGRLASLWTGVPLVHHVHGHTASEVGGGLRHRFHAWVERLSLTGAAKIIAVSPSSARYMLQQGISAEQLAIVPNGIPPRPLSEREAPRDRWMLGIVGLFRPRKGLEVLLRSLALLRSQGRRVQLRAVGPFETSDYEADVRRLTAELQLQEHVDWRGFRSDVAAELAAMDLFVFPSILPEGMPMVLLEAMAAGVPIIGTKVDGVTDVLCDNRAGLLASPGDAAELAAAIARVMADPELWRMLRAEAHAQQVARFSDRSMAEGVAAAYREILEASSD